MQIYREKCHEGQFETLCLTKHHITYVIIHAFISDKNVYMVQAFLRFKDQFKLEQSETQLENLNQVFLGKHESCLTENSKQFDFTPKATSFVTQIQSEPFGNSDLFLLKKKWFNVIYAFVMFLIRVFYEELIETYIKFDEIT